MARRVGKAANRKARQRSAAQRAASRPGPTAAAATAAPVAALDSREAVTADPPRRVASPGATSAGSTLTIRERAEYHYVERDLRNIGILTAIIAALLLVAWIAFSALGVVG